MTKLFRLFLAALRMAWMGWLKLLALSWRWLARLLGLDRAAGPPRGSDKTDTRAPASTRPPRGPVGPRAPPAAAARAGEAAAGLAPPAADEAAVPAPAQRVAVAAGFGAVVPTAPPARRPGAEPGQFIEGVFRADAGQRDYKLYVPGGKPQEPLPLVVMLHGCKQDPDDFAAGTQMNRLADDQPMLVLYPAQTRAANVYACWNWFSRRDQERDAGEPSIIAGMIHDVLARHSVDPKRVYVAGLSAGGAMATILAHTYPELLAAAGVHSGLPFAAAQDMITALGVMKRGSTKRAASTRVKASAKGAAARPPVPLIVFHGDHDKTVHPLNGEHVVEQALAAARAGKPHDLGHSVVRPGRVRGGHAYTRTIHSDRAGRVQVEHWLVQGSGHAWSGGDAKGSFTDPLGPDASSEMLRFFLECSRV